MSAQYSDASKPAVTSYRGDFIFPEENSLAERHSVITEIHCNCCPGEVKHNKRTVKLFSFYIHLQGLS